MRSSPPAGKLIELEATRGIAAIVVLFHHLLLAFFPRFHGLLVPDSDFTIFGTPFFAFVNGSAAVVLFFVLSGFVLTVRSFQTESIAPLIVGAVKRWPRLLMPVTVVNLVSGALLALGLYFNRAVAADIGSPWMNWFFASPPDLLHCLVGSFAEGVGFTFVRGSAYFNSSLWTMRYEFFGSFFVFGLAGLMLYARRGKSWILAIAFIAAVTLKPFLFCFVAGVALAHAYSSRYWDRFSGWLAARTRRFWLPMGALIVFLVGYHELIGEASVPTGVYAFITPLSKAAPLPTRVVIHTAAALALLTIILALPWAKLRLGGKLGALLGRLSFPIYLLQVPVICSLGAGLYAFLAPRLGNDPALITAFVGSAVATVLAAFPLAWLEGRWLHALQSVTDRVSPRLTEQPAPSSARG